MYGWPQWLVTKQFFKAWWISERFKPKMIVTCKVMKGPFYNSKELCFFAFYPRGQRKVLYWEWNEPGLNLKYTVSLYYNYKKISELCERKRDLAVPSYCIALNGWIASDCSIIEYFWTLAAVWILSYLVTYATDLIQQIG